jgi:toxin ParE1/3/4
MTSLRDDIGQKFLPLAERPTVGPARPDIAPGLCYFPVRRYSLLYREITDGIEIVRVVHGSLNCPHADGAHVSRQSADAPSAASEAPDFRVTSAPVMPPSCKVL